MLCCACLEAHVDLEVEHVVVRFCQFAVVNEHILCVELDVLAKTIVGANLILGLGGAPLCLGAIHVVTCLEVNFVLLHRSDEESVETVGLVAGASVDGAVFLLTVFLVCGAEAVALAVDILGAEGPVVLYILATDGVAVTAHGACAAHGLSVFCPCACAGIRACPSECADAHAAYRHEPDAADDILAVVHIFHVDALAVEHAHLIVEHTTAVGVRQKVTLQLHAYVASVACLLAHAVTEASEFRDVLSIAHESLVDGVHGVLERERAFELSDLDACLLIFLPFGEGVDQSW